MPLVGFEPAIPASELPQTYAADRAATVCGLLPRLSPFVSRSSHTQNRSTYHRNCYEDAEQDDQAEGVPRELLVCWFPDVGPVGAGRGHIARHPASPEKEQNTSMVCICAPHHSGVRRMINVMVSFRLRPRHPNGKSGR